MRFSLRKLFIFIGITLVSGLSYLLFVAYHSQFYQVLFVHERFDKRSFKASDDLVKRDLHYTNYLFSEYQNFTKLFGGDVSAIKSKPLQEKCTAFFNYYDKIHPEWELKATDDDNPQFDKGIVNKNEFFVSKYAKIKLGNPEYVSKEPPKFPYEDKLTINEIFKRRYGKTKASAQTMADTATIMRLYGKCFLGQDNENQAQFKKYTKSLFPFSNNQLPTFELVGNDTDPVAEFPIYDEINKFTQQTHKFDPLTDNLIDFIHKNSNGRGIVISASTRHSRDLVKLIRVLRALNNKLPIQVIHKSDLNRNSRTIITHAATSDIDSFLGLKLSKDQKSYLPDLDLKRDYSKYGSEFPKQELWFVNIAGSIERKFKYAFPGYGNKILAMLFSSFKEILLLDADTVPLSNIEDFFNSDEYKESSAYFFLDRALRDHNDYIETNFFSQLFPANKVSMDSLFNIPLATEKTLGNKYMTGWRHLQEAGVVAINKRDHYLGILMMLPLLLWKDPVKSSIWGEKEMYWLGLSMAGDENYQFNKYGAASVGELTTNPNHTYYPSTKAHELCSTHPGHVDKNGKLLWINSGFSYCKKNGFFRDRIRFPFTDFQQDVLEQRFAHPQKIRAALIPPDLPKFRESGSPSDTLREEKFKSSWSKRKKDIDEINANLEEGEQRTERILKWIPQKGWIKNPICLGYMYCAYDKIQTYGVAGDDTGHLFEFDDETVRKYDYLSKIWFTGTSKVELNKVANIDEAKASDKIDVKDDSNPEKNPIIAETNGEPKNTIIPTIKTDTQQDTTTLLTSENLQTSSIKLDTKTSTDIQQGQQPGGILMQETSNKPKIMDNISDDFLFVPSRHHNV